MSLRVTITDDKTFPIHVYRNGEKSNFTLKAAIELQELLSEAIMTVEGGEVQPIDMLEYELVDIINE